MYTTINDTALFYDVRSCAGRPYLVFINSLGTDARIWNSVIAELGSSFNIITIDKPGHGLSGDGPESCSIEQYASYVAGLLDFLKVDKAYVCGISIGGLIAQALYHLNPDRIAGMVLSNTGLKIGDDDTWNSRISTIKSQGLTSISAGVMERWFSASYIQKLQHEISAYQRMFSSTSDKGYIAACIALRDADLTDKAGNIHVPVTCIASDEDISTPVDMVTALS
ncbi:MAG: alpha/beta fold hydrolase, partial [Methyloligellaceae bacterium]